MTSEDVGIVMGLKGRIELEKAKLTGRLGTLIMEVQWVERDLAQATNELESLNAILKIQDI